MFVCWRAQVRVTSRSYTATVVAAVAAAPAPAPASTKLVRGAYVCFPNIEQFPALSSQSA